MECIFPVTVLDIFSECVILRGACENDRSSIE